MVIITPKLVRPLNPDDVPPLPTSIKDIKDGKSGSTGGGLADAPASKPKPNNGKVVGGGGPRP
jgi:hypothetical protein